MQFIHSEVTPTSAYIHPCSHLGNNIFYKLMLRNSSLVVLFYRLILWRIEWPYKLLTEVLDLLNHLTCSRKGIGVVICSKIGRAHV